MHQNDRNVAAGFRGPVAVISNAASAIYASGGHVGRSCVSRPSAAVPLVALPGISTYLPEPEGACGPMDACCAYCA